jgi:dCMP deaminase
MAAVTTNPTYDEYFREFAFVTSKRSPCMHLQTGCVIVHNNRLLNQAHNTYIAVDKTDDNMLIYDLSNADLENSLLHAEQNAISDCARRGISCEGATIYCTHLPSLACVRLIIASGIKSIKYHISYNEDTLVPYLCHKSSVKLERLVIEK